MFNASAAAAVSHSPSHPVQIEGANFLNLLIVDDDRTIREACREVAQSLGFNTQVAESAEHAYRLLDSSSADAVLLDLRPGSGGLEALHTIKKHRAEALVIVVTGYGTVQSAVQAMKDGAYDYVTKPFSMEELRLLLERVGGHLRLKTENRVLRETIKSRQGFANIIGRAPEMEKLYRIIAKAGQTSHPVLILGESGTGKELVAKSIHFSGTFRNNKPFIPVDCGSLVPTLIESELFGHVRGAFTGATNPKDGLLAIAEGGTVFLDEIGELPTDLQAKLLRAIQEKEIRPVGSVKRVPINVRILAATNRNLERAVAEGTFRRDLFFRLNVLTLRIPPLRERRQDIPLLVAHILERIGRDAGGEKSVSDEALKALLNYDWPGNVRELENSLERACALTSANEIQVRDLPTQIYAAPVDLMVMNPPSRGIVPMAELEKQTILAALSQVNGDKMQAARLLGIGKTTLYRKLKEYAAQVNL